MMELLRPLPFEGVDGLSTTEGQLDVPPRKLLQSHPFRRLMTVKLWAITPLLGGSLIYIFGVALLAGYAPRLMSVDLAGSFNVGYLLVLAIYPVCWLVSIVYVLVANKAFESLAINVASDHSGESS